MTKPPRKPYPQRAKLPLSTLLWRRVKRGTGSDCWPWDITRATNKGYGVIRFGSSCVLAHRAAWIVTNGPIPNGLHVLHKCDNPPCCNPAHLFLGTQQDNTADCIEKNRFQRGERQGRALLTDATIVEVRRRWLAGERASSIAKDLRVHYHTVRDALTGKRWKHVSELLSEVLSNPRSDTPRGSRQTMAKLTESDIPNIREMRKNGGSLTTIAAKFGVTRENIWHIVSGKGWKHVA